jgi:hypothetical protein
MPFVPVADTVELVIDFVYAGHPGVNTLYCTPPAVIDFDSMSALAAAVATQYQSVILPSKHPQFAVGSVTATDISVADGVQSSSFIGEAGTLDGTPASAALAAVIRWHTALRGRRHRGRIFDCGYDDVAMGSSSGGIPDAFRDLVVDNWLAFRSALFAGDGTQLLVASRAAGTSQVITDITCAPVVGVQRRRLRD